MPEVGKYLLTHVGFTRDEKAILSLQNNDGVVSFSPLGQTITLEFDMSEHFCVGWYDMRTGESHICPESAAIEGKYDQCPACQQRTGFNPAFYHANTVSTQQEERNLEPHMLYLAHFGKGIVKVGISHAARGNARLLEQGARSALILDIFPTAHIARQYEAQIAALPGIAETLQVRKKIVALSQSYDNTKAADELNSTQDRIETTLTKTFSKNNVQHFDATYFPHTTPKLEDAFETTGQSRLSGKVVGMLGSLLFCEQQDTPLFLPLKKYTGYSVTLSFEEAHIDLPARQISLF